MCLVAARMVCHFAEESQMVASIARMFARDKNPLTAREKGFDSSIIRNIGNNQSVVIRFWLSSQRAVASEKSAYLHRSIDQQPPSPSLRHRWPGEEREDGLREIHRVKFGPGVRHLDKNRL